MKLTQKFIALFTVWQVAYLCSLFVISYYYSPSGHLSYSTPISFHYLIDGFHNLNLVDIKNNILNPDENAAHYFHWGISVISIIVFYVSLGAQPKRAITLFAILSAVLLFTGGGLGTFDLFFGLLTQSIPDGEWLGEGWPHFDTIALWMFSCMYLCYEFYKHSQSDTPYTTKITSV